jgi:hypothetical protein
MARGFVVLLARGRARFAPARCLLWAALAFGLAGCPQQELAPIAPCTVSLVSVDAKQSGTDQVDLLFVIDNSGSMAEEQVKLNAQLPRLVQVLTTGDYDGMPNADGQLDFRPVGSLRLGVVSVDLGSNGVIGVRSCGSNSYSPIEPNINAQGADSVDKPFGDNALLLNSTAAAVAGVSIPGALGGALGATPTVAIQPRPECNVQVPRVLEFPSGGTAADIATRFSCVAELGANGCSIEQQLESMWKALAPSTDVSFSRGSGGQGLPMGLNAGFLRPEAILAIIIVSDEEDCSSPDGSAQQLYGSLNVLTINSLCGRQPELLHPIQRYIAGLNTLKAEQFRDRIIFGGIVGVPLAAAVQGQSLAQILARPDMQYAEQGGGLLGAAQGRPVCTARGGAGSATPARRIVQVAQGFGDNGVITSICEDNYAAALNAVIEKIAGKLSGECLPRSLVRNSDGIVECRVVEIKAPGDATPCNPARGRIRELPSRQFEGTLRRVCEIEQLAVRNRQEPTGIGWYYDDFSNEVNRCMTNRQRIAFSTAAAIENGAAARFECFRPAQNEPTDANARGLDAVNSPCIDTGQRGGGEARCRALSTREAPLTCVNNSCQLSCTNDTQCTPPKVCAILEGAMTGYCVDPTCPL